METIFQGKKLTQKQSEAVAPVINARMIGRITRRNFEMACLKAMDDAGCPFILEDKDDTDAAS